MPASGGQLGDTMEDARKMGKSELFSHFAERFDIKRTQSREFFDELAALCEKELKRTGEFVIPGMVKLVLKKTNARTGRNPATGQPIPIAAKTVVKARIVKQLKDAVLPKKTPAQEITVFLIFPAELATLEPLHLEFQRAQRHAQVSRGLRDVPGVPLE